jgi:hypothetical protein
LKLADFGCALAFMLRLADRPPEAAPAFSVSGSAVSDTCLGTMSELRLQCNCIMASYGRAKGRHNAQIARSDFRKQGLI